MHTLVSEKTAIAWPQELRARFRTAQIEFSRETGISAGKIKQSRCNGLLPFPPFILATSIQDFLF